MTQDGWQGLLDVALGRGSARVYVHDRAGRCIHVSRAGAAALDTTPEDMLGRRWTEVGLPVGLGVDLCAARERTQAGHESAQGAGSDVFVDADQGLRYSMSRFASESLGIDGVVCRAEKRSGHDLLTHAALYGIAEAVHTTPDLRTLCRRIYHALNTLMPAQSFAIALLDADDPDTFSYLYMADRDTDSETRAGTQPGSRLAYVARTGKPLLLSANEAEELARAGEIQLYRLAPSAWLGAPLVVDDQVIGAIGARHDDIPEPYSLDDLETITFIARQVGVAIDRKRTDEELSALTEALEERVAARTAELDRVIRGARCSLFHTTIARVGDTLQWDSVTRDGAGFRPMVELDRRPDEDDIAAWERSIHPEDAGRREDVARDAVLSDAPGYEVEYRCVDRDGRERWMREAVSLATSGADRWEAIGVITDVTDRRRAEDDLRASEEQRGRLMRRVLTLQEDERSGVAWKLHERVAQELWALMLGLRTVQAASSIGDASRHAGQLRDRAAVMLEDVRQIAFDMRPSPVDDVGLEAALGRDVRASAVQAGLTPSFHVHNADDIRLPAEIAGALYRVADAAVANVVAHANATALDVVMDVQHSTVSVLVQDDGVGFDVDAVVSGPVEGRFGLLTMEERMKMVGGNMVVESQPGKGATVLISAPLAGGDLADGRRADEKGEA